jgi:hypothetical protein
MASPEGNGKGRSSKRPEGVILSVSEEQSNKISRRGHFGVI